MDEIREGNLTYCQQLQHLGNKFMNASEIIQHTMHASEADDFINTNRPENRTRMLLPREQLLQLPEGSTEIYVKGAIEHYSLRPTCKESLTLADFVAEYNYSNVARAGARTYRAGEEEYEKNEIEDETIGNFISLRAPIMVTFGKGNALESSGGEVSAKRGMKSTTIE